MIHQAITTKYLPCTNTRGARIKATAGSGYVSITVAYADYATSEAAHYIAAVALLDKLGWTPKRIHQGGTRDGYVFVMEY